MRLRYALIIAAVLLSASPCRPKGMDSPLRRASTPSAKALQRDGFTVSRDRVAAAKFDNINRVENPASPGAGCSSYFIGARVQLIGQTCTTVRDGTLVFNDGSEETMRVFGVLAADGCTQWDPGRPVPLCPADPSLYLLLSLHESVPPVNRSRVPVRLRLTFAHEGRKPATDTVEISVRP